MPSQLADFLLVQARNLAHCPREKIAELLGEEIMKVVALEKIEFQLLLWYPLLNLIVCFIFQGDGMLTFSLFVCLLLFLLRLNKIKITINFLLAIVILILTVLLSLLREGAATSFASSIAYATSIVIFILFSEKNTSCEKTRAYFLKNKNKFYLMQTMFLCVLVAYVSIYGLYAGWDTHVLKGPYLYPHTLAYLLLFMEMINLYYWLKLGNMIPLFFFVICAVCILLTAVRTVLISLVVILLYVLYKICKSRKFNRLVLLMFIGCIAICAAYSLGVFDSVIDKTNQAIFHSSITNGRGAIVEASMKALNKGNPFLNYIFGVGMDALMANNLSILGSGIHAHNDFIDVLVCYGVINFTVYIFSFLSFAKKHTLWIFGSVGVLALFNGLFPYFDILPIIIYSRILIGDDPKGEGNT